MKKGSKDGCGIDQSSQRGLIKFESQVRVDIEDDLLHITLIRCFYVSISTDVLEKEWYGQLTTFLAS